MPITLTSDSGGGNISGYYGAQTDMQNVFGSDQMAIYSDLSNNSPAVLDSDRIQDASDYADSEIDGFFQDGPFTVPLSFTSAWSRKMASRWYAVIAVVGHSGLYYSRGTLEDDKNGDRYKTMRDNVYAEMRAYKSGAKRLAAQRRWPTPTAPCAS